MGRADGDLFLGFHLDPAFQSTPAWEHKRVRAVVVNDGNLKIAVERRGGDRLPHLAKLRGALAAGIDLDQPERFGAVHESLVGPDRELAAVQQHSRFQGVSGPTADGSGIAAAS
jgi:hypothetical protein